MTSTQKSRREELELAVLMAAGPSTTMRSEATNILDAVLSSLTPADVPHIVGEVERKMAHYYARRLAELRKCLQAALAALDGAEEGHR